MHPLQAEPVLVSDDWMDQYQYSSVYNLHPEPQSYSYDVALGAGRSTNPFPIPNTCTSNNTYLSSVQVNNPCQHAQFPTPTNVNGDQYSNVYEPRQPPPVLPLDYALEEADFLAPSTGIDQSGNTFFPTYDVFNAVPQSYLPLLPQSTSLGLPFDGMAGASIAPPYPASVSERLHESSSNLHGQIQYPEPNTCQECRQSFPSNAELERHAKSHYHDAFQCKCGKPYARLDNLKRHWNLTPKFPCPHCDQYTGVNAFTREDHLTQHLRTFHRINTSTGNQDDTNNRTATTMHFFCILPNCTHHQRSFQIKSQYTDHMRRIHNYSPFPCLVQGCVKTGGKGYFRERDLFKHSQEAHSVEN